MRSSSADKETAGERVSMRSWRTGEAIAVALPDPNDEQHEDRYCCRGEHADDKDDNDEAVHDPMKRRCRLNSGS